MEKEDLHENTIKISFKSKVIPNVVFYQDFSDPDLPIYMYVASLTKMLYRFNLKNYVKNSYRVNFYNFT